MVGLLLQAQTKTAQLVAGILRAHKIKPMHSMSTTYRWWMTATACLRFIK